MNPKIKKIIFLDTIFFSFALLFFVISYFFSGEIIHFKKRSLEEDKKNNKIESFQTFALPIPKEIIFKNDTVTLNAWYFKNPQAKDCGVILLHGFTGTRWAALKYAPIFWKRGCDIFTYDHRRHGESSGEFGTFGFYEKFDLIKGTEIFSEISNLRFERIGVLGESYGAATAILAAGKGQQFAFVIAESSYKDFESIIAKQGVDIYGPVVNLFVPMALIIASNRGNFDSKDVSPYLYAKSIQVPILFIHSKADNYTPYQHSEEIYSQVPGNNKMLVITDWNSNHGRSVNDNFPKFEGIVLDFLRKFVPSY